LFQSAQVDNPDRCTGMHVAGSRQTILDSCGSEQKPSRLQQLCI